MVTRNAPSAAADSSLDDPFIRRLPAAQYVGVSPAAFDRLVRAGRVRVAKNGSAVGSRRSWLNDFLDSLG
jgi:hypothetical protein